MKIFQHDFWLQVYMYYFMYVDPETMSEDYYSKYTKTSVENTI